MQEWATVRKPYFQMASCMEHASMHMHTTAPFGNSLGHDKGHSKA